MLHLKRNYSKGFSKHSMNFVRALSLLKQSKEITQSTVNSRANFQ
jgi:hypothetical protein